MATGQMNEVIQLLRRTVLRDGAGRTDGQLLEDYLSRRDEAALASIVLRHGPMVWAVCRRVLRNDREAEDAFQASFLVLVRKATSIVPRHMVANWLYGVAHRTACNARAAVAKRKERERQVTDMPEPAVTDQDLWHDLQPVLDEELTRLPDKYRSVVVLCDLEGKSRKEAARQIGCPEGTVAGWLARARVMLAKRLTRRGVVLSGGALAAVLSQNAASANVPTSVVVSTIKAATSGAISVNIAALAEGVTKAMLFNKLKAAIAVLLLCGVMATGATILSCRSAAGQHDIQHAGEIPVVPAPKQEKEKEPFTAWGTEVGGLQAGLGFRPGEKRDYHWGETVTLVVRVRNVGKKPIEFQYVNQFFVERPPTVTDSEGRPFPSVTRTVLGRHIPREVSLAPGKEIELYELKLKLRGPSIAREAVGPDMLVGVLGKVGVQYEQVFGNSSSRTVTIDPALSKLATGKLELEIRPYPPPDDEKKQEDVTAWGEPAGGLQAGLALLPGEKRVYHHGEVVTLLVRVRNVGKDPVKFEYLRQFLNENLPTVAYADGRMGPQPRLAMLGEHTPVEVMLKPGQETVLESRLPLRYEFRPADGEGETTKERTLLVGSGKVSFQCERVLGNSSAGAIKLDPALSKLGTGKLEVEVKPPPPAKKDKQGDTAWGKPTEGLQAGIAFRNGEPGTYLPGQSVNLEIYLRNTGDKKTSVSYIETLFEEWLPGVVDTDGKTYKVVNGPLNLGQASIVTRTLEKGEAIRLGTAWFVIVAPGTKGEAASPSLVAPPERYLVNLSGFPLRRPGNDSDEQKWATGQVALQIGATK